MWGLSFLTRTIHLNLRYGNKTRWLYLLATFSLSRPIFSFLKQGSALRTPAYFDSGETTRARALDQARASLLVSKLLSRPRSAYQLPASCYRFSHHVNTGTSFPETSALCITSCIGARSLPVVVSGRAVVERGGHHHHHHHSTRFEFQNVADTRVKDKRILTRRCLHKRSNIHSNYLVTIVAQRPVISLLDSQNKLEYA